MADEEVIPTTLRGTLGPRTDDQRSHVELRHAKTVAAPKLEDDEPAELPPAKSWLRSLVNPKD